MMVIDVGLFEIDEVSDIVLVSTWLPLLPFTLKLCEWLLKATKQNLKLS